ncbi:MAG: PolC-type DNA polymerase III, partial [Clostridiaceae bacterium]
MAVTQIAFDDNTRNTSEFENRNSNGNRKIEDVNTKPKVQQTSEPEIVPYTPKKMPLKDIKDDDDTIILGKPIKDVPTDIKDLTEGLKNVAISGVIFKVDEKELKNGTILRTLYVSDNTGSIMCKCFLKKGEAQGLKEGIFAKLKGSTDIDAWSKEFCLKINHIQKQEIVERNDRAQEKRVELHAHTFMSAMDAVVDVKDLVKTAIKWGHSAIGITDHGVVQAFPDAMLEAKGKIKILYGVEAYVVDDLTPLYNSDKPLDFKGDFVVFDLETTGFSHVNDRIIEIGAVRISNGIVKDRYSSFVDPGVRLPAKIVELTNITDSMLYGQRKINEVLPEFLEFVGDTVLVAHNANFDMGFIRTKAKDMGLEFNNPQIDTVSMARYLYPELKRHRLDSIAKHLNIFMGSHHRAVDDAETTAQILLRSFEKLEKKGITDMLSLNVDYSQNFDISKGMPSHVIIYAKNQAGLKKLYELISISHLKYFNKNPRIPKSLLQKSRENLLLGSACSNGELFKSILDGRSDKDVDNIAAFYDYFEIMPISNNEYLLEEGRCTVKELKDINRRIIEMGKRYDKPVVATGDVHMLNPEDEIYRRVIKHSQGFTSDLSKNPLPFLTTKEMLDEFSYLGDAMAKKVVIDEPNRVASMLDSILPIPKETFPPKMEGAEDEIRNMTMDTAYKKYGKPLPEIVQKRLDKELNSIIGNGYAVLYLVAHMLVKKSLDDGYLVGSRGSVGSSLVATFTDITEVNGLQAHYLCPECKYSEFIESLGGSSGVDLPPKKCPQCGHELGREGHDIPFETFLGFEGDKEPDIDLNFSGVYQPVVHKYCEEIFGKGYTFRAGTIGTIAEKTAMGYVKKYYEDNSIAFNKAEMERLAKGCTGIKRTTGQHPGGIMVVPSDNDIHNFTPVQRPADDNDTDIITTHFDYHSISGRLLKLDILCHDDPTMLKMLQDLTGVDPKTIPLNEEKVISLFSSPKALGVTEKELDCPVGTYGIPEFGTKFVRQMLLDTKPKNFSDLVRISGLSHGTNVWLNNAQEYIKTGQTDLEGCISLRDNIMLYLIGCGLPPKEAFNITEKVRKGKGLTEAEEATMKSYNVPDWYIESCKKIKYMFPKGHAVAYVTMAVRVGWYKIYFPLEYYATYFTVRAKDFDLELALKGESAVKEKLDSIISQGNFASPKEQAMVSVLELVY